MKNELRHLNQAGGKDLTLRQWSQVSGINLKTLFHRIERGMSVEEAVNRKRHKKAIKEPAKEEKGG
jgi:hypothetical protein